MKVLCPQCDRLSELEQFRFDHAALVVVCTKCGVETRVTANANATSAAAAGANSNAPAEASYQGSLTPMPSAPPRLLSSPSASNVVVLKTASSDAVEKAASSADSAFAVPPGLCPKCLSKRQPTAEACGHCGLVFDRLDPTTLAPPDWLAEAWVLLLRSWGDEGQHEQLRRRAMQLDALPAVGRLYRLRLASMPDDPYALRGRDEVVRLASVPVATQAVRAADAGAAGESKVKVVAVVLVVAMLAAAVLFALKLFMASRGES